MNRKITHIINLIMIFNFVLSNDLIHEFTFLSTGNVHGETDPCGWKKKPLGGLARKATLVDQIKQKKDDVLIFDAGNLFFKSATSNPGLTQSVVKETAKSIASCFNEIGCDAFSPGENDFAVGLNFLLELKESSNFQFISANIYNLANQLLFDEYKIFDKDGIKIGVIGLSSNFLSDEIIIKDPYETLNKLVPQLEHNTDFIVVLFSSVETDIAKIKQSSLPIDLIIRSKSRKKSNDGGNGKIPIYSIGDRGKHLYQFDITEKIKGEAFEDIAKYKNKMKSAEKRLNKMKNGNMVMDLHSYYQDDKQTLDKVENYELQIEESLIALNNAINILEVKHYHLDKSIDSRPDILKIIDKGKQKIISLSTPELPSIVE